MHTNSAPTSSGSPTPQVFVSFTDVTEMEDAKRKASQIAIELTHLLETANAPIFGVDMQGCITEWNAKAAAMLGYSKAQASGQQLCSFVAPESREAVHAMIDSTLSGSSTENFELHMYSRCGDRVEVLLNATARFNVDGKIVGVVGVGQDVTRLRLMNTVARKYAHALGRITDVVFTARATSWDADEWDVHDASASFAKLFSSSARLLSELAEDQAALMKLVVSSQHVPVSAAELRILRHNGEVRTAHFQAVDISELEGRVSVLLICHDLTDFKKRIELEKHQEAIADIQRDGETVVATAALTVEAIRCSPPPPSPSPPLPPLSSSPPLASAQPPLLIGGGRKNRPRPSYETAGRPMDGEDMDFLPVDGRKDATATCDFQVFVSGATQSGTITVDDLLPTSTIDEVEAKVLRKLHAAVPAAKGEATSPAPRLPPQPQPQPQTEVRLDRHVKLPQPPPPPPPQPLPPPLPDFYLSYGGRNLDSHKTLAHYKIREHAQLQLHYRGRAGHGIDGGGGGGGTAAGPYAGMRAAAAWPRGPRSPETNEDKLIEQLSRPRSATAAANSLYDIMFPSDVKDRAAYTRLASRRVPRRAYDSVLDVMTDALTDQRHAMLMQPPFDDITIAHLDAILSLDYDVGEAAAMADEAAASADVAEEAAKEAEKAAKTVEEPAKAAAVEAAAAARAAENQANAKAKWLADCKILAKVFTAVKTHKGWSPNAPQKMATALAFQAWRSGGLLAPHPRSPTDPFSHSSRYRNLILKMHTGAGKTCTSAMLAACICLATRDAGKPPVDIFIAADAHAADAMRAWGGCYTILGLNAAHQLDRADESECVRQRKYRECDVLYTTIKTALSDLLFFKYGQGAGRPRRGKGKGASNVTDEVDIVRIEQALEGLQIASGNVTHGFAMLEPAVRALKPLINKKKLKKKMNFQICSNKMIWSRTLKMLFH